MALKAVSSSPSSSATAGGSGAAAAPGAAGLLGATGTASAGAPAAVGTAGANGQAGAQSGGTAGCNFLQMLTQTSANGSGKTDAKGSDVAAAAKPADDSQTSTDPAQPDAIAMALALVAQSMAAQQPSVPAGTAKAAGSRDSGDGSGATSATSAIGATGSADGSAAATAAGQAMQKLLSLLTEAESDSESAPHTDAARSDAAAPLSTGSAAADGSIPLGTSSANPHLSVGSHFAPQHTSNDARTVDVKSPVGTSAWADELGGKITWMAHQGIDSASLRLSPEHLGPVEVRISVQDGATSVMFGAAHADTRSAIEQALPRLREMFATHGLTLADAGVSREPPKQPPQPSQVAAISAVSGVSDDASSAASALRVRLGLLDTYA